ncbi:MAG: hypothetical protein ACO1QB_10385 [Verrucomicrobiales bacterium]
MLNRNLLCALILMLGSLASLLSSQAHGAERLKIEWENNMLFVSSPGLPGGKMQTWYLEAFCRSGSTTQAWDKTTIPHSTKLISTNEAGTRIELKTIVEPSIEIFHEIVAGQDEVTFKLQVKNIGLEKQDVQWFQPCVRVDKFTGEKQNDYITKSFIFTPKGLQRLSELPRNDQAIYKGGQVYVPRSVPVEDVNPRPISSIVPSNNLIGCFSADEKMIFATAWSDTQELFQGVIVCLHNDPRIGGLAPGETKELLGKMYFLPNDPKLVLQRYERDFGKAK